MDLLPCQQTALNQFAAYARGRKDRLARDLDEVLRMSEISASEFRAALGEFQRSARVALHFHPDRPTRDYASTAESMTLSGVYQNQFQSGISNGALGGERPSWEDGLFEGAYRDQAGEHRPKYGALEVLPQLDGPAPRFGSCFFLLKPEVTGRCTFTYLDSHQLPVERGTLDEFEEIISKLFIDCFVNETVLGLPRLRPRALLKQLCQPKPTMSRNLNHYVEAQVHGPIDLRRDVLELHADPSFRGRGLLEPLCQAHHIPLVWHPGSSLETKRVPRDFRGPEMPALARQLAPGGTLRAFHLGHQTAHIAPQQLKLLWHVLVRFGKPC